MESSDGDLAMFVLLLSGCLKELEYLFAGIRERGNMAPSSGSQIYNREDKVRQLLHRMIKFNGQENTQSPYSM